MAFEYNDSRKETGVDVTLEVPGGTEVPVTNVSFSEEVDTSEVQFNDSYTQNIAVTGVTYSGSFEIAGRNESLRDAVWQASSGVAAETNTTELPIYLSSITFVGGGSKSYTFSNVLVTSHSKDAPADDRTTESYDFSAEKLTTE